MPQRWRMCSMRKVGAFAVLMLAAALQSGAAEAHDWESVYRARLKWWSLAPVAKPPVPKVKEPSRARNEVDLFILAAQQAKGLKPVAQADKRALARRLSFALTGLPISIELSDRFLADGSPRAFETLLQSLMQSPHFGEHWARHWMDVVHYSDTHGYEWDAPAKNAWMYRDYLVRAFNADIPFRQLVLEQVAGDLIAPRVDAASGLNESLIGLMALRMGERRHGDNGDAEGVTQEAMADIVDTLGKSFLGTTLACAQCHDHKLDAVGQRDFYALTGVMMSTRWNVRTVDTTDPNLATIEEMRRIKLAIASETAKRWLGTKKDIAEKIRAIQPETNATTTFPESLVGFWKKSVASPVTPEAFALERARRVAENKANLKLLADFTREDGARGWQWDGAGMRHGLVRDGEMVIAADGNNTLSQILPAGRWSHVFSQRLSGAVRSPLFDANASQTFSVELAAGRFAARSFIVDQAFHSERMQFMNQLMPRWQTLTAGSFATLEGGVDRVPRRVYLELVTKSLNNYFPPRTGYGGLNEAEVADERSWLGLSRIVQHPAGKPPLDELARFAPLAVTAPGKAEWADRLADILHTAIERWSRRECDAEDVRLINEAIEAKLLPNDLPANSELARHVASYRDAEKKLQPDRTIGAASDWNEGRDERVGIRGSYTQLGATVPRGTATFLGGAATRAQPLSSGRLELAQSIIDPKNPLTARVFVNRVWLHLFGEGLVRTPDDFGHLGEAPSHPELIDHLAARFVEENWSLKKLVATLVTSATWRQGSIPTAGALKVDPENRLWHHMPLRRLEAEAIRDSMLSVSGRLDAKLYGAPTDPYRAATDASKRLLSGPLDGNGRRSLYTKMTLMDPPRFLALFNQPIPKLATGRRDVTHVPDQALAILNDPFVIAMARHWSERLAKDGATSAEDRAARMLESALARPASPEETARLVKLVSQSAALRGAKTQTLLDCQPAWQDVAHAIFNLKEFIHVP